MSKVLEEFRELLGILNTLSGCKLDMNSERIKPIVKELQALNIIKNKRVNVNQFLIRGADYNCCCRQGYELTTDEIYLLREILIDNE